MPGSSNKYLKRVLRDKRQAKYFSFPKSVLSARIAKRIEHKAEARKRYKAELAELRSSWEAEIAEIAKRYTLPSPEAAVTISKA